MDINHGIRIEGNRLVICDEPVKIEDNKIIFNDKEYEGTPQLWAMIVHKSPDMTQMDDDMLRECKRLTTDFGVDEFVEQSS